MARKKKEALFAETSHEESQYSKEYREMMGIVARLSRNQDFVRWLTSTLNDLSAFNDDEGVVTEFGQGIRKSASRIINRLLIAPEGAEMIGKMYADYFAAKSKGIVQDFYNNNK